MKKWILFLILTGLIAIAQNALADVSTTNTLWKSSFTATNDTALKIPCNTVEPKAGCKFHGVIVSSAGVASTLTIYDSSATAINPIAVINTSVGTVVPTGQLFYDLYVSSGLSYTTVGATPAKVTILYAKPSIR